MLGGAGVCLMFTHVCALSVWQGRVSAVRELSSGPEHTIVIGDCMFAATMAYQQLAFEASTAIPPPGEFQQHDGNAQALQSAAGLIVVAVHCFECEL